MSLRVSPLVPHARGCLVLLLAGMLCAAGEPSTPDASSAGDRPLQFNDDILPILSDNCFKCHGPDSTHREADLRLDTREGLFARRGERTIVVPGKPEAGELVRRIRSADPDERMPPPESGLALDSASQDRIERWIRQGAQWQPHWSLVAPHASPLPHVRDTAWCRSPIDRFVLARLEKLGLAPSPEADRATWLRRVTFDLTGLPPTPEELDAYLADASPTADERVVDRLLASPRFGEQQSIAWLDLARYADTSGYQNDGPRSMWRWRDWVIESLNENMPFDQFTILQLAGDLLDGEQPRGRYGEDLISDPHRLRELIATGFNRNHRGNAEGGIIPEEFQVEYVVDRVETMATTWLGLTLGCARCHDHKYDPFSQREFYQLFAFFNNVPEFGRAIKEGNSPPYIKAPTDEQFRTLTSLDRQERRARRRYEQLADACAQAQTVWEHNLGAGSVVDEGNPTQDLVAVFPFDGSARGGTPAPSVGREESGKDHAGRPELRVAYAPGPLRQAVVCDGEHDLPLGDVGRFGYFDAFTIGFWVYPQGDGTLVSRMTPVPQGDGYGVHLENGRIQVNLVKRWLDDAIRVETLEPLARDKWQHIVVTYDGSRRASGIRVALDGHWITTRTLYDFLNQSFANDQPLRVGYGHAPFRGAIDELRIYARAIDEEEIRILATPESVSDIVELPADHRTPGQRAKLRRSFLRSDAGRAYGEAYDAWQKARRKRAQFLEQLPTVMIMQELDTPRETHVLLRGQYDQWGERVEPDVPAILPPLPSGVKRDRLALARWLVDPSHPLTARVAVNRYWQQCFGTGLVSTPEDFGVQGARPTHPQLLDWLAVEFQRSGWDVKHMFRLITLSATYRQTSVVDEERRGQDPDNILLARGPRVRLTAEMIRDQALFAGGLLSERLGGPSVKIYQPEGLWREIATDTDYELSTGADLYRRSLYAYWKRTVSPPAMATFDAPTRETCVARRPLTNTPLQSLAVMNDVTYIEAARALAERVLLSDTGYVDARLDRMFRRLTSRYPTQAERAVLQRHLAAAQAHFQADPKAARQLTRAGKSSISPRCDEIELAAYTMAASLIMNLDETLTKE